MRTIHKQLVQVKRQITFFLRTWIWIAVVSSCCVQGVTEIVVDFKSDSHKKHLVFDAEFANLVAEGNHELVLIENGDYGLLNVTVSIVQVSEESRTILWRGQSLAVLSYKVLVGNIDSDEQDEVIVHRAAHELFDLESPDTVRVIEFENDQFQETLYTTLAGEYGALIDIDNDQKSEVVLIVDAIPDLAKTMPVVHPESASTRLKTNSSPSLQNSMLKTQFNA